MSTPSSEVPGNTSYFFNINRNIYAFIDKRWFLIQFPYEPCCGLFQPLSKFGTITFVVLLLLHIQYVSLCFFLNWLRKQDF